MNSCSVEDPAKERKLLNPFVFPSELTLYFVYMLMSLVGPASSLAVSVITYFLYPLFTLDPARYPLIVLAPFNLFLFPVLTYVFYTHTIKSRMKKYGQYKLEVQRPEILTLLRQLCERMNLQTPETFYVDSAEINALAFGSEKHGRLLISTGLCEKWHTFQSLVETILIHELSHIKNRDLVQHEIAESLWRSFAVVTFVSIFFALISSHNLILDWLPAVMLVYLIPLVAVFYLNNVIARWREIYADARTICIEKTDRNMLNVLSFFSGFPQSSFPARLFSPFLLTSARRIKIIKQDIFRHTIERGLICAAVSGFSWLSGFLSLGSLAIVWNVIGYLPFSMFVGVFFLATNYFIFLLMCLPFWVSILSNIRNTRQDLFHTFVTPLKISIVLTSVLTLTILPLRPGIDLLLYLFIATYMFLLIQKLLLQFSLSFFSLNLGPQLKLLIPNFVLVLLPMGWLIHILNLGEPALYAIGITVLLFGLSLLLMSNKYAKCPFCRKSIVPFSLFRCRHCSHPINQEFFITLDGWERPTAAI